MKPEDFANLELNVQVRVTLESENEAFQYSQPIMVDDSASKCSETNYSFMKHFTTKNLFCCKGRNPKFFCFTCGYFIQTRLSMITHMKMHRKPFCAICFETFHDNEDVSLHILDNHPEFAGNDGRLMAQTAYSFPTAAPPNSPSRYDEHTNGGTGFQRDGIMSSHSVSLVTMKLEEHQRKHAKPGRDIHQRLSRYDSIQRPAKSQTGTSNVKKTHKLKCISKAMQNTDQADTALVRITSRFGRSISLKVPQF
ncbi:uncharacterized protein LOC118459842 [Anopheles albimanus]|uniref:Uncharacterized protein n=1 Tax=Anopheles albimanus TaxID=7167 RepID=A0A182F620_ANOAL|nr:uncharacterized protein LOC118459842 [Anopheles albimanus]